MKYPKFRPKDIIATLVLGVCFWLIANGINSTVSLITTMVVTFYFGSRFEDKK